MRRNRMKRSVIITKEDDWYVARDVVSQVASQGRSLEESIDNLKEALALYYEGQPEENRTAAPEVFFATLEVAL